MRVGIGEREVTPCFIPGLAENGFRLDIVAGLHVGDAARLILVKRDEACQGVPAGKRGWAIDQRASMDWAGWDGDWQDDLAGHIEGEAKPAFPVELAPLLGSN
jgi:hypothetical protein